MQTQLAEYTRVCAYDRAGLGFSEPANDPRDPLTIVGELHTLLKEAGVSAPYVLAGHSFGAVLTRIYTAQYPEETVGMVLVDSQLIDPPYADQGAFDQWKTANDAIQILALDRGTNRDHALGFFRDVSQCGLSGGHRARTGCSAGSQPDF